jgi:hypothetical protein
MKVGGRFCIYVHQDYSLMTFFFFIPVGSNISKVRVDACLDAF